MKENFIEKHKNPENSDIYVPSQEDLETKDFKFLYDKLTENHKKLLPRVIEGNYPFFALHGTNSNNTKSLLESEGRHRLELATFYEKEKDEFFLYKLYAMARYVASYADKEDLSKNDSMGSILVFNVEENNKNSTHVWEHLFPTFSGFSFTFENDSPEEREYRGKLSTKDNLLYRTDAYFDIQKELSKDTLKVIQLEDFQQLVKKFKRGSQDLAYELLKGRFRDQKIIEEIFKIYKKD